VIRLSLPNDFGRKSTQKDSPVESLPVAA
jgi:hypothetical protein